jgi:putative effector of murein hydrolase
MSGVAAHLWPLLASNPLIWLVLTLGGYLAGRALQTAFGGVPFVNPVLVAIAVVMAALVATGTSYRTYFAGAQLIHFLLGPATIALAIPLARHFVLIRVNLRSLGLALLAGSTSAIIGGVAIVQMCGGSQVIALSMAPKAATTPIAMAVSKQIGGMPELTASLAILGGITAAIAGQWMFKMLAISDWRAQGLAAGVAGSGIAAAHVAARNETGAAFAAIGVGMNGLLTALLVPLLVTLWY